MNLGPDDRNSRERAHQSVSVRVARRQDARPLAQFFLRAWKEAGPNALGFTGASDQAIKEIASEEFLTKRIKSPHVRILVAREGRRVIGFASLRYLEERLAELTGIVVLKDVAGIGIGTRLLQKACLLALGQGFTRMVVKTEAFNLAAIGFYRKNGFNELRNTSEKVGRKRVPLKVLQKPL